MANLLSGRVGNKYFLIRPKEEEEEEEEVI